MEVRINIKIIDEYEDKIIASSSFQEAVLATSDQTDPIWWKPLMLPWGKRCGMRSNGASAKFIRIRTEQPALNTQASGTLELTC